MAITLTTAAANRVKAFLHKRGSGIGLRLSVKTTGCSGFAYVTEFIDSATANDIEFVSNEVHVFVAKDKLQYLDGTEIDFIKDGLQENFKYNNPQVKAECGCGESFSVN
jgi:iron-sulfur cluster assembly protein